ncbi:Zn-dependent exopeptidase M28 [Deinococcus piscis]|uniref:Zn-dependent exopeptidase M28 n=1 Tax=Deinococcus piscis TaxID=394230 RepID=A0ABQ3K2P6_9DEIO|nr:M20/M25/M40 family metallo-hydrolase [Deinococcus piscis]GHG00542.1 Zn-dependent exopeptidase M28 [Deinococcus piscis]
MRPAVPLVCSALSLTLLAGCGPSSTPTADIKRGERALAHMEHLSRNIGPRVQGTPAEAQAREYVAAQLRAAGYQPELQPLTVTRRNAAGEVQTVTSGNVMAVQPGASDKEIIVVAHLDSVDTGRGADDNASGVGVLLEAAEALRGKRLPHTVRFLAVGAEEGYSDGLPGGFRSGGLKGSSFYTEQMSDDALQKTLFVVNLDSLAAGDHMNIYGSAGEGGYVRDAALELARTLGHDIRTSPGLEGEFPAGSTGDWSDHAPFAKRGLPYAYFEATNWELGDKDGYTQTEKVGSVWHTPNDTPEFLNAQFPGRTEAHLRAFSDVLIRLLQAPPSR